MKKYISGFAALLLLSHCFSQTQVKKPITPTTTVIHTKESAVPKVYHDTNVIAAPKSTKQPIPDYKNATLVDALITVTTGKNYSVNDVGFVSDDNKDGDTHWSCGTFDQANTDITSFHDNSDHDVYNRGSVKNLQMTVDKVAKMSDFSNIGRYHINIAPNGNDTWNISEVTITMDFDNPKSQQKLTWKNLHLTQDRRDVDMYFHFDGTNLVVNP